MTVPLVQLLVEPDLYERLIRDILAVGGGLDRLQQGTGKRREIDCVVGFRLGNATRFASVQSTYPVES